MNEDTKLVAKLAQSATLLNAVKNTGNFTHAAHQLAIDQSAVSHRIRMLERALGMRLFERTTRKVAPTEAGEILCAAASSSISAWERALAQVRHIVHSNTLRISLPSSLAMKWLIPALPRAQDSGIELTINVSDTLADLSFGEIDLAIRFGKGPYPGLHSNHLAHCQLIPVASPSISVAPDFLKRPGGPKSVLLSDRQGDQDGTHFNWRVYAAARDVTLDDTITGHQFDRADLMLQAAVNGMGIALGRTLLIEHDLAAGFLKVFGPPVKSPSSYWLVSTADFARTEKFDAARNWLNQEVARTVDFTAADS